MSLELLRFYLQETTGPKKLLFASSLLSGLCRGFLITIINAAIAKAVNHESLTLHIIAFIGIFCVYLFFNYFAQTRMYAMVEKMTQNLRLRIMDKLLLVELGFIENYGDNRIYARLTQDVHLLSRAGMIIVMTFENSMLLLFTLLYIGWLSPIALAVTIFVVFAGCLTYIRQQKKAKSNIHRVREKEVEFYGAIGDALGGFKELKLSRSKKNAINDHVQDVSDVYRDLTVKTEKMFIVSMLTTETFLFTLIGSLIFVVPYFLTTDTIIVFQFIAALLFLIGPLDNIVSSIPRFIHANVARENVCDLERKADSAIDVDENKHRNVTPLDFDEIKFNELGFQFSGNISADNFALGPVNLTINRGEILFMVGGNGSGKTTLVKLLTGLYLPTQGQILIDGKPLAMHDYQAYREMYSAIFSDFHLFKRLYGVENANITVLNELLKSLHLDNKTQFDGAGFSTVNLSTGQRKRLAYIGTILENKQIFVFDEFAADQDPMFRQLFYRNLLPGLKAQGKTIICISHDDNYFDACDRIIKLDYGKIVYNGEPSAAVHDIPINNLE